MIPSILGTSGHKSLTVPADFPPSNELTIPHAQVKISAATNSPKTVTLFFICLLLVLALLVAL
jgi:hypothetical protein